MDHFGDEVAKVFELKDDLKRVGNQEAENETE